MPDWLEENKYQGLIVGVDEAGRGPWVGPVVAGAVVFFSHDIHPFLLKNLNDSKKLTAKKREDLFNVLQQEAELKHLALAIGVASAQEIDDINILQATFKAMQRAVEALNCKPDMALIDGNRNPLSFPCPSKTVIKGDAKSFSIAAASVIAKVYRDNLMKKLALQYPGYGFEKNAGYGTKEHIEALQTLGVTPEHRKSYKPVAEILAKSL